MYQYIPGVSRLVEMDGQERSEFRSQYVTGPQHLDSILTRITDDPKLHKVDLVVRGYFWLAFSGLYEEDTYLLTAENLNFEDMTICYDGMVYPMYRQSVQTFRELASAQSMRRRTRQRQDTTLFPRAGGDQLLRTMSPINREEMRVLYGRVLGGNVNSDGAPIRLNYRTVYFSGLFFRAFEMERVTGRYDFKQQISDYFVRRYKHKERDFDVKKLSNNKECTLKLEYCKWKTAFPVA